MDRIMQQDIIKTYKSIHYSIESAVNSMLSDNDLTASQSHALMFILASGGDVTASEIHRRLGISRPTVSGLIKKLRSKGYVTIEGDESDERLKHIIATDKAGLRREEICSCMSRVEDITFEDFTDEELKTLHSLINRMADNLARSKKEENRS